MRQRDFERSIGDKLMPQMKQGVSCPPVMGWPEDDVSKWVASHRDETKNVICRSSEGRNVGFCRTTRTRTRTKPIETKGVEMSHADGRKTKVGAKATARAKATRKSV